MSHHNDIANQLLHELCAHLFIDPRNVRQIRLDPRSITVETFELNDEGRKFIGADGNIALAVRTVPFQYQEPIEA